MDTHANTKNTTKQNDKNINHTINLTIDIVLACAIKNLLNVASLDAQTNTHMHTYGFEIS